MAVDDSLRAQANPTFRFLVTIGGEAQAAFTECTLPVVEWEMQEVKEGGLNVYTHQLPVRRKGARITLKNGVGKSQLLQWYIQTMNEQFKRKPISVSLLDARQKKIMIWDLADAYPIKWTGPQLKSDDNSIAIQTLEFVGGELTIEAAGN